MSVYVIAQLRFTDVKAYRRYQQAFPAVFARHEGRVLVADEGPVVLEGSPRPDKVIVLEFADEAAAVRFLNDPEYQRIGADRKAGAETLAVLAHGLSSAGAPGGPRERSTP